MRTIWVGCWRRRRDPKRPSQAAQRSARRVRSKSARIPPAALLACLHTVRPTPETPGPGHRVNGHGSSCPHTRARNSVAVTTVLDGRLQVNVFLACGIAT